MNRHLKIVVAIAVSGITVAVLAPLIWHRLRDAFEAWAVGIHQRSTTRELAEWEKEFSQIRNKDEAIQAVNMLRYVQGYYVPGPGYHSDSATEAALEEQRQKTMSTIAGALEAYTGERYGVDVEKWEAWRDSQMHEKKP
jgi:hypothetical protein